MPAGPGGEGYSNSARKATFQAERTVNTVGPPDLVLPQLIPGTLEDLAMFRDSAPGTFTRFGGFEANGHRTPLGTLKPKPLIPPHFSEQAILLTGASSRRTNMNGHSPAQEASPQPTIDFAIRAAERPPEWEDYHT